MTGAELLEQVRDDLADEGGYENFLLPALEGCVLLNPAEQERVRAALLRHYDADPEVLALVTPSEPFQFDAPGEGDPPHDPPLNEEGC